MTETTQKVLEMLKTRKRVVLRFKKPKENEMAKKKATKKTAKKNTKPTMEWGPAGIINSLSPHCFVYTAPSSQNGTSIQAF